MKNFLQAPAAELKRGKKILHIILAYVGNEVTLRYRFSLFLISSKSSRVALLSPEFFLQSCCTATFFLLNHPWSKHFSCKLVWLNNLTCRQTRIMDESIFLSSWCNWWSAFEDSLPPSKFAGFVRELHWKVSQTHKRDKFGLCCRFSPLGQFTMFLCSLQTLGGSMKPGL